MRWEKKTWSVLTVIIAIVLNWHISLRTGAFIGFYLCCTILCLNAVCNVSIYYRIVIKCWNVPFVFWPNLALFRSGWTHVVYNFIGQFGQYMMHEMHRNTSLQWCLFYMPIFVHSFYKLVGYYYYIVGYYLLLYYICYHYIFIYIVLYYYIIKC